MQGDFVFSWVKTLLADAFYWTDNDLVVQTRSMYGGSPRTNAATFLLDRGGGVSHFNYFSNERTADAITRSLLQDQPADFARSARDPGRAMIRVGRGRRAREPEMVPIARRSSSCREFWAPISR